MTDPETIGGYPKEWFYGDTLSRLDVARIFNVDPATVTRWAKQGVLGFFRKPGGTRVFPQCEVERLMRDEAPSEFIKLNAERDNAKYRAKWAAGFRNSGVTAFQPKEYQDDDPDDE